MQTTAKVCFLKADEVTVSALAIVLGCSQTFHILLGDMLGQTNGRTVQSNRSNFLANAGDLTGILLLFTLHSASRLVSVVLLVKQVLV